MQERLEIPFPLKGLSENYSFDVQEPGTTRDLLNVRAVDPKTGRTRGAQRSGLNRFLDDQLGVVSGANSKVQEIVSVPINKNRLQYATVSGGTRAWAKRLPNNIGATDIKIDDFGNIYVLQADYTVTKYNYDGGLLSTITVPDRADPGTDAAYLFALEVDEFQNVFVCRGTVSSGQDICRLYAFEFQIDGSYRFAWTLDAAESFYDCAVFRRADGKYDIFALTGDIGSGGTAETSTFRVYSDFGFASAPTEDTTKRVTLDDSGSGSALEGAFGLRMAVDEGGTVFVCGKTISASLSGDIKYQRLWKLEPYSDDPTTIKAELNSEFGVGLGIAIGPKNSDGDLTLYTMGDSDEGSGSSTATYRRIVVDPDAGFQVSGTDAWEIDAEIDLAHLGFPSYTGGGVCRIGVDAAGNAYFPAGTSTSATTNILVHIYAAEPASGTDPTELNHIVDNNWNVPPDTNAVAVLYKGRPKDFDNGDSGASIEEVERVFVILSDIADSGGLNDVSIVAYDMVSVTQSTASFRDYKHLALGGGIAEVFTSGGAFAAPATGTNTIDETAPFVQASVAVGLVDRSGDEQEARPHAYVTDGRDYYKYDPVDDEWSSWVCASAGVIPPRCRLIETWQGRVVLSRDPKSPHAWHMSKIGDPENWDNFPQNISPAQAISGINSKAGDAPDIVNSLMPWNDDILIFGGDRTIWALRGNPMLGGQFDLITDQVGMAFGRCWCKEPGGQRAYFVSNFGGVYALSPGSEPIRLTRDRIERRIQDAINWGTHYTRVVWNYRDEGLHVFQCPFGAGGTVVKHWFWDRKNDAWFEDQFGTTSDTNKQPTAVYVLDGDAPADRTLLLGCEDGRIRAWDEDSPNDDWASTAGDYAGGGDDLAIDSYVTIGPIQPRDVSLETQFSELTCWLAPNQDGVNYDVFVDDEPDEALSHAPKVSGALLAGRNPGKLVRFSGDACYLRLRNANASQRWAFERASIMAAWAGAKRKRT